MENILTGFKRYFMGRLRSLNGEPSSIAAGVAWGVAVTFTPFVGLHALMAMSIAWISGASVLAAAVGTVVGNPWTFPFIWLAVYYTGRWLMEGRTDVLPAIDFEHVFSQAGRALMNFNFDNFATDVWPVVKVMMVGCIPFCIAAWIISYYIILKMLAKFSPDEKE